MSIKIIVQNRTLGLLLYFYRLFTEESNDIYIYNFVDGHFQFFYLLPFSRNE